MTAAPARLLASAALAAVLLLTGCASTAPTAGAGADAGGCRGTDVPLSELDVLDAPREYVGETSACLASSSVMPVADDVTPELPATVVDNQGTEVTVTDTSRILALDIYGTLAATVYGLGLGDSLVGRDTSTRFSEVSHLPLVTQNGHELNAEAMLDLQPTVILTDSSIGPWDVVLQMRDAGIPVVIVTPERSMENSGDVITAVAAALGVPDAGEALAQRVSAEIDDIVAQVDAIAPAAAERPRMMLFYMRGTAGIYYIFGDGSGADSLIESLGGIDVASEIGWKGMRPMTAEAVVDAAPDIILVMSGGLASVDGVDGLLEQVPAIAETPAGQHRRIIDMDDHEVLTFGPRSAAVIEALARAVYAPEQSGRTP